MPVKGNEPERTLVYGITSLGRQEAGAVRRLSLVRGHGEIENRSHWIRDPLLREDESRSSKRNLVQVLTSLRCAALTLLPYQRRRQGDRSLASLQRRFAQQPEAILALTGALG
jgi:hypothetical protein